MKGCSLLAGVAGGVWAADLDSIVAADVIWFVGKKGHYMNFLYVLDDVRVLCEPEAVGVGEHNFQQKNGQSQRHFGTMKHRISQSPVAH